MTKLTLTPGIPSKTPASRGHTLSPITDLIFISLYLKAFIKKLVQVGKVVLEKIWVDFLYVHDPGPRSGNDLDL